MRISASAPTRIDLAGGTIDIWPLYLFHPGAQTLNVAISLRARAWIEPRPDERVELIRKVMSHVPNVDVRTFDGLAVTFVRNCESRVMVRGVRPLTDIAGEFTMMMANRQLDDTIETVFLMADEEYSHVSSSLIKQIVLLSPDDKLAKFVPREIIAPLRQKMSQY